MGTVCFNISFLRTIYWKAITANKHKDLDFDLLINRKERKERKSMQEERTETGKPGRKKQEKPGGRRM